MHCFVPCGSPVATDFVHIKLPIPAILVNNQCVHLHVWLGVNYDYYTIHWLILTWLVYQSPCCLPEGEKETHFKYTQWILHTRAWSNCSMPATQQFNRSAWHLRLKVHLYLTVTRGETSVLADRSLSRAACPPEHQWSRRRSSRWFWGPAVGRPASAS